MTLPLQRDLGQNLAICGHFLAFSVTILVVTAINMLTLGIRCTCIILRHIPSWFKAVLAIAILWSYAQGGPKWPFWGQKWPNMAGLPMSQSGLGGPKWSQMINKTCFWSFGAILGPFGPFFYHFLQKLIFCQENTKCFLAKVIWSKNSSFVWNDQKESKWAQNGPNWSKICYSDHFGSF